MDGNTLSPADVMLMTKQHCNRGMAATGVGLAAGLGGGALLLAIGLGWGLNQASKARAKAAEQAVAGNQNALNMMSQFMLTERNSRETWQNVHTPTIKQYVDVSSTAQQGQQTSATALAALLHRNRAGATLATTKQREVVPRRRGATSFNHVTVM